jgi:hypothetical protein
VKHEEEFELKPEDRAWADAFREAIHAESARPAWFWGKQRAAIRGRISSGSRRSSAWMAFASAAALVLFAVLLMGGGTTTEPIHTVQVAQVKHVESDQQVISDVQETIDNPIPESMAPLDLLAQDMDKDFNANSNLVKQ